LQDIGLLAVTESQCTEDEDDDEDEDDSNYGIWAKDTPTPRNVIAESIGRFPVLAIRIVAASGGDSTGAPRSSSLLDWWRSRWEQCSQGSNGL
jgi:hypothetical protein